MNAELLNYRNDGMVSDSVAIPEYELSVSVNEDTAS